MLFILENKYVLHSQRNTVEYNDGNADFRNLILLRIESSYQMKKTQKFGA